MYVTFDKMQYQFHVKSDVLPYVINHVHFNVSCSNASKSFNIAHFHNFSFWQS